MQYNLESFYNNEGYYTLANAIDTAQGVMEDIYSDIYTENAIDEDWQFAFLEVIEKAKAFISAYENCDKKEQEWLEEHYQ